MLDYAAVLGVFDVPYLAAVVASHLLPEIRFAVENVGVAATIAAWEGGEGWSLHPCYHVRVKLAGATG